MLAKIFIYVCLIADPSVCKSVQMPSTSVVYTPSDCYAIGAAQAKDWLSRNPKWKLLAQHCIPQKQ